MFFETFTEKAIQAIIFAQEESRRLGHNFLDTEHILLGLISEKTDITSQVFASAGVNIKECRAEVEKIIGRGSGVVSIVNEEIPFTLLAKQVLEKAQQEAYQQNNYVEIKHLLLSLIAEEKGGAVRVLENLRVDLDAIRKIFQAEQVASPRPDFSFDSSTSISNYISELAKQRSQIWEKYRNSLSFVTKLKELEAHSSENLAVGSWAQSINVLGSGQPPEEIRLTISEVEAEVETVKLLEAEVEGLEKEIKTIQGQYILWGVVFLLIGVGIWLWFVGWFVQVLILLVILFLLVGGKKKR